MPEQAVNPFGQIVKDAYSQAGVDYTPTDNDIQAIQDQYKGDHRTFLKDFYREAGVDHQLTDDDFKSIDEHYGLTQSSQPTQPERETSYVPMATTYGDDKNVSLVNPIPPTNPGLSALHPEYFAPKISDSYQSEKPTVIPEGIGNRFEAINQEQLQKEVGGAQINSNQPEESIFFSSPEEEKVDLAKNILEKSERQKNAVTGEGNNTGVGDALRDRNFWTLGSSDMSSMIYLKKIANKLENGEGLSDGDKALLEAWNQSEQINQQYPASDANIWYKTGKNITDMVPWLIQFAATRGMGTGTRKAVETTLRANAEKYLGTTIAKGLSKGIAETAGAYAAASLMPNTYADITRRSLGQTYKDEIGSIRFDGESADGNIKAIYKGWTNGMLEVLTERLGEGIGGALVKKWPKSKLVKFITGEGGLNATTNLSKFTKSVGWDGAPMEYFEEFVNIPLNALLVGDSKYSDVMDEKWQLETLMTVVVMGQAMKAVNATQNQMASIQADRDYKSAKSLFDTEIDPEVRSLIIDVLESDGSLEEQGSALHDLLSTLDGEKAGIALNYIVQNEKRNKKQPSSESISQPVQSGPVSETPQLTVDPRQATEATFRQMGEDFAHKETGLITVVQRQTPGTEENIPMFVVMDAGDGSFLLQDDQGNREWATKEFLGQPQEMSVDDFTAMKMAEFDQNNLQQELLKKNQIQIDGIPYILTGDQTNEGYVAVNPEDGSDIVIPASTVDNIRNSGKSNANIVKQVYGKTNVTGIKNEDGSLTVSDPATEEQANSLKSEVEKATGGKATVQAELIPNEDATAPQSFQLTIIPKVNEPVNNESVTTPPSGDNGLKEEPTEGLFSQPNEKKVITQTIGKDQIDFVENEDFDEVVPTDKMPLEKALPILEKKFKDHPKVVVVADKVQVEVPGKVIKGETKWDDDVVEPSTFKTVIKSIKIVPKEVIARQKQADTEILLDILDEFNATPQSREDNQKASEIEAIAKQLGYQTERNAMNQIRLFDNSGTIERQKVAENQHQSSDQQNVENIQTEENLQKNQLQNEKSLENSPVDTNKLGQNANQGENTPQAQQGQGNEKRLEENVNDIAVPPVVGESFTPGDSAGQNQIPDVGNMVEQAAAEVDTNPTDAQKEAGNYKKGHVTVQGMDITIENPKGSFRRGVDEDGRAWETEMKSHYGYFKQTTGKDGDHIDTFIGDNPDSQTIFVVDQNNTKTGAFDESKVMLGYNTPEEAKAAYLANYEPGWKGFGSITPVSVDEFKTWLYDGAKQRKPFAEYKNTPKPVIVAKMPARKSNTITGKAKEVEVVESDIHGLALQYFVNGGTVKPDEVLRMFRDDTNERNFRRSYTSNEEGLTVAQIAHNIWEALPETIQNGLGEMDIYNTVEGVIREFNTPTSMAQALLKKYSLDPNQGYSKEWLDAQIKKEDEERQTELESWVNYLSELEINGQLPTENELIELFLPENTQENGQEIDSKGSNGINRPVNPEGNGPVGENLQGSEQGIQGKVEGEGREEEVKLPVFEVLESVKKAREKNKQSQKNDNFVENKDNEIPESVSQGERTAQDKEDQRLEEIASRLADGISQSEGKGTSNQRDTEASIALKYAKENGLWINDIYSLGEPFSSGNESTVVVDVEKGVVYKSNNLMNSITISNLLQQIKIHNQLFPSTRYSLVGFTGIDNGANRPPYIEVVLSQPLINESVPANDIEINQYMKSLGFERTGDGVFSNGDFVLRDIHPRNVLKDATGDIYVIDNIIKSSEQKQQSTPSIQEEAPKNDQKKPLLDVLKEKKENQPEKIEDFGEKIEGARKDQIKKYFDKINLNGKILSTIFPKPDIKALLESGLSAKDVAGIKVAHEFATQDKKKGERVIKFYAAYAKNILAESINLEYKNEGYVFTEYGKSQIELRTKAYQDVYDKLGAEYLALDLTKVKIKEPDKSGRTTYFRDGEPIASEDVNYIVQYYVNSQKYFATLPEAIDYFTEQVKANTKIDQVVYKRKLNIYYDKRVKGEFYIGYPSKGDVIKLKDGFKTSREAFEALKNPEILSDLQTMLERILSENRQKSKPAVRLKYSNETARERVGKDWRNGKDIGSKELAETFGFRAIEFGNWVNQKERQVFVNNTYDSLMDLAQLLNISPKAISLAGNLGLTFGSRGSGKAAAHYEPGRKIINLTKTQGLGSLAHEWWHGVDNYFADFKTAINGMKSASAQEYSSETRDEIKKSFNELYKAVNNYSYKQRSQNLDGTKNVEYFSLPHEMSARAFENYTLNRLAQIGQVNDFIVNYISNEDWNGDANKYPYPIAEESVKINEAFQQLFDTIQEKEENGNVAMFRIIGETGAANLDKAEEATTRLDNLAIAREMEHAGKDAKSIRLATGWEKGVDGKWRYEVPDSELSENYQEAETLEQAVNDPELFKAYPQLKEIKIGALSAEEDENSGSFHNKGIDDLPTIYAGGTNKENLKSVLLHEIQHSIQHIENFADGGSPNMMAKKHQELTKAIEFYNEQMTNAYDKGNNELYQKMMDLKLERVRELNKIVGNGLGNKYTSYGRLAGEVESRNVQTRMNMTPEERLNTLLSETEDVAREDQIVIFDGLGVNSMSEENKPFKEIFQERHLAIQDLKDSGVKRLKVNSDGTVSVYHGTSSINWEKIQKEGFKEGSFFSVSKSGTEYGDSPLDVAKRKFGNDGIVVEVRIDPRDLSSAAAGSELYSEKSLVPKDGHFESQIVLMDGLGVSNSISDKPLLGEIQSKIDELQSIAPSAAPTEVIADKNGLPEEVRNHKNFGDDVEAVWYKGRIYILADKVRSIDDLVLTWIHENGIHNGLRNIVPSGELKQFLGNVYDSFTEVGKNNPQFQQIVKRVNKDYQYATKEQKAEEMLAYLSEKVVTEQDLTPMEQSLWRKYLDMFRDFLKRLFNFNSQLLTEKQIVEITRFAVQSNFQENELAGSNTRQGRSLRTRTSNNADGSEGRINGSGKLQNTASERVSSDIRSGRILDGISTESGIDRSLPLLDVLSQAKEKVLAKKSDVSLGEKPMSWREQVEQARRKQTESTLIKAIKSDVGLSAYDSKKYLNALLEKTGVDIKTPIGNPTIYLLKLREAAAIISNIEGSRTITPELTSGKNVESTLKLLQKNIDNSKGELQDVYGARFDLLTDFGSDIQNIVDNKTKNIQFKISKSQSIPETITVSGVERPTRNNKGQFIHTTKEGIENFWKWFGDSKVVDAEGRPLVVYHGGAAGTTEFDPNRAGSVNTADWGKGIYFTPARWVADGYREDAVLNSDKESDRLYEAMVKRAKELGTTPMNVSIDLGFQSPGYNEISALRDKWIKHRDTAKKNGGEIYEAYLKIDNPLRHRYEEMTDPFLTEAAKHHGNDGIIVTPMTEYIVFSPSQIKSATGNNGSFNPDDNNINFKRTKPEPPLDTFLANAAEQYKEKKAQRRELKTVLEGVRQFYQDHDLPIRRMEEEIKKLGGIIRDNMKPYRDLNLSYGRMEELFKSFVSDKMKPILKTITEIGKTGMSREAVLPYVICKRATELNPKMREKELKKFIEENPEATDTEIQEKEQEIANKDYAGVRGFDPDNNFENPYELAQAIVDEFESLVPKELIDQLWTNVKYATTDIVKSWEKANMITPEQAEEMIIGSKYYVPLRGWREGAAKQLAYVKGEGFSRSMQHAEGRKSLADNPLAYIYKVAFQAIGEQTDTEVKKSLLNLVAGNYGQEFKHMYELKKAYYVKTILDDGSEGWRLSVDPATGEIVRPSEDMFKNGEATTKIYNQYERLRTPSQAREHEVVVKASAGDMVIVFKNKYLPVAQAMNKKNRMFVNLFTGAVSDAGDWNNKLIAIIGSFNNFIKANLTSRNIVFPFTNILRDSPEASLTAYIKGESGARVIKNMSHASASFARDLAGKTSESNKYDRYLKEFRTTGGTTGYSHMKDIEQINKEFEKELRRMTRSGFAKSANLWHKAGSAINTWSDMFETTTRLAVFISSREAGKTAKEAASDAKEYSVNFNRKGKITKALDAVYAFFNVSVQSLQKNGSLAKNYPKRFSIVASSFMMLGFLEALLNDWYTPDDDDDDYYNVNEYVRENYLVLPTIFAKDKYVRLPLPQFWRSFKSFGSIIYDTLVKERMTTGQATTKALGNFIASLTPIDLGGLYVDGHINISPIAPSVARPFAEVAANRDYMANTIAKEPFTKEQEKLLADSGLGKSNVNPAIKFFTDFMAKTGGKDGETRFYRKDGETKELNWFMDWNPSKINHIVQGYLGGTYKFASDVITTASQVIDNDKEFDFNNVPFVNSFIRKTPAAKWRIIEEYYNLKDNAGYISFDALKREKLNNLDLESYKEVATDNYLNEYQATLDAYDEMLTEKMKFMDYKTAEGSEEVTNTMKDAIKAIKQVKQKYNRK